MRQNDLICRLGGDEFVIISAPIIDQPVAEKIASKIAQCLDKPFTINHRITHVTASIGIVFCSASTSLQSLIKKADRAMYKAKRSGKNGFKFYTSELAVENKRRDFLSDELKFSIQRNEFALSVLTLEHFKSGEQSKEQGVYTWNHNELGEIPAEEFLAIAESTGHIVSLEVTLISQALCKLESLSFDGGAKIDKVSMPISQVSLSQPEFLESNVLPIIKQHSLACQRLSFEVPVETICLNLPNDRISKSLELLRSHGSSLVLSHVSGQHLSILPLLECQISRFKLAESMVANAQASHLARQTIRAICAMAHALDIDVVATKIQTQEDYERMKALGCDYGQGSYIDELNVLNMRSKA